MFYRKKNHFNIKTLYCGFRSYVGFVSVKKQPPYLERDKDCPELLLRDRAAAKDVADGPEVLECSRLSQLACQLTVRLLWKILIIRASMALRCGNYDQDTVFSFVIRDYVSPFLITSKEELARVD